jgi:uncharacterized protein (TIGR00369 family)
VTAELTDTTAREGWGPERSRTVTWHDPGPSAAKGLSMAGVDYLRAMIDGTLPPPPVAGLMQFDLVSADPGRVVFNCRPDESAYNPIGAVHGGLVCALLDAVLGCALHSTLPQGRGFTSVEIKVSYLKAVRLSSGLLTAPGPSSSPAPGWDSPKAPSPTPQMRRWPLPRARCWSSTSENSAAVPTKMVVRSS